MSKTMFDTSAADFAASTDHVIAAHNYVRGRLFIDALRRAVPVGSRVLDFGCGPGRIARLAAEAGYDVDGVDFSDGMIAEATKLAVPEMKLRFRTCDGIGDDLTTATYRGIVCSSVVEYIADADRLLANLARALEPGGVLAISYCNRNSLWRAYARATQSAKPHYTAQVNIWSYADVERRLDRAGFNDVSRPVFLEASPFDKRPPLRFMTRSALIGTLGFVVARKPE